MQHARRDRGGQNGSNLANRATPRAEPHSRLEASQLARTIIGTVEDMPCES
jgi:hypothetical protein